MEGGNPFVEYLTYGMIGVVLLALGFLALRTAWFFLSLLAIPLSEAASRWAPTRRAFARWGERGARRDPTSWRHAPVGGGAPTGAMPGAPAAVRRGLGVGALLGAVPGLVLAVRGGLHTHAAGGSLAETASAVGIGIGLVAAAGALLGAALGAGAGLAWDALASRRR
jgi:hypothetical protein